MARRQQPMESEPPTLSIYQAVELIKTQLARLDEIRCLPYSDPKTKSWISTTQAILDSAFGKPHGLPDRRTSEFLSVSQHAFYVGISNAELQRYHVTDCDKRKALLEAYIEQLQVLAPPAATTSLERYTFHAEIERVSGQLYRDGHYKQAALEAYIRVIDEVKRKSGLAMDGDTLMNQTFGCDSRTPVLRFNTLQSDAERDEQRGLMYLFKGIVGLRNSKAHSNRLFDDPSRGHEYLALASALMRLLEIAEK